MYIYIYIYVYIYIICIQISTLGLVKGYNIKFGHEHPVPMMLTGVPRFSFIAAQTRCNWIWVLVSTCSWVNPKIIGKCGGYVPKIWYHRFGSR